MSFILDNLLAISLSFLVLFSPRFFRNYIATPASVGNLAASLGILFTFIGISWGLINFDVKDIEGSVPLLLDGLKTAFFTSCAGILTSVLVKARPDFYGITKHYEKPVDNRPELMIGLLKDINNGIAGNNQHSIVGQIELLRNENNDNINNLNASINHFADKIVENSIEQLIEALAAVMEDFNSKINDRLTTSIDQLNDSTKNLLAWQTEYAEQIEDMNNQFVNALDSIDQAKKMITDISRKSELPLCAS